ncbi:MAG: sarcosine oxidase subunit alpha, partial [Pelagibacteraceae bacterium]|nr:sarcosine oxidase subunit alpha [Pelagibacteraceae bacterium]
HFHYHCDLLIIGGGASGLYAAKLAKNSNLKILLIEQNSQLGGEHLSKQNSDKDSPLFKKLEKLNNSSNLKILKNTTVFAYMHSNYLLASQKINKKNLRQVIWKIRAKKVVLATGSIERFLTFNNNDRPGIILANSARKYINYYSNKIGKEIVIFTNNDSAYKTALDFHLKNVIVKAIVDVRKGSDGDLVKKAKELGIKIFFNSAIINTEGRKRINKVFISKLDGNFKKLIGNPEKILCDLLCVSGGWTPNVNLFSQSRGKLVYRESDATFIPNKSFQEEISIGSCNGTFNLDEILEETYDKMKKLLDGFGEKIDEKYKENTEKIFQDKMQHIWIVPTNKNFSKTKMFVDFQNDVTAKDIKLALQEGYKSIEHIKRYTTTGMATDQGKISNINAQGIISDLSGVPINELGTTTFRLPYTPVSFGAMAGRNIKEFFDVERTTPMHQWHINHGAKFEDVGQWKRAWYYPKDNEDMSQAVNREVAATRRGIGILDASTLGKIDIKGKDSSEFLNRVYTNSWSKLAVEKCRYGLMLGDDGMVIDDGVTTRISENHYIMTTTTGGAASVMSKLEDWLQTEWPDLKVYLTSVTEQFATISLNGPFANDLMKKLYPNFDFSKENFPHMSFKAVESDGIVCRIMRISFTGEMCYEINVPSSYAKDLWEKCFKLGKEYNITPYGTEAMHVLRAEKGFIIVGQETDGSVTPIDLDMNWIVSKNKYDFIGKRALSRSDTIKEDRKQLVGILTKDPNEILEEGAQLVESISALPMTMVGHITSSYYSPNLGRSIALALVRGGLKKKGGKLFAPMPKKTIEVKITDPVFIDPSNNRLTA